MMTVVAANTAARAATAAAVPVAVAAAVAAGGKVCISEHEIAATVAAVTAIGRALVIFAKSLWS